MIIKNKSIESQKKEDELKKRIGILHSNNIGLTLGCEILNIEIDRQVNTDSINEYIFDNEIPDKSFDLFENTKRFNLFRTDYLTAKDTLIKKLESNHELVEKCFKEKANYIIEMESKNKIMKEEL